jgi:hypothetical protein
MPLSEGRINFALRKIITTLSDYYVDPRSQEKDFVLMDTKTLPEINAQSVTFILISENPDIIDDCIENMRSWLKLRKFSS